MTAVISLDEAAQEFKIGRRTLERKIAEGLLPVYRKGAGDRKNYLDREEVKSLLGFKRVERPEP